VEVYRQILKESKPVDKKFSEINGSQLDSAKIVFEVPKFHPRAKEIANYSLTSLRLEEIFQSKICGTAKNNVFIADYSVGQLPFVRNFFRKRKTKPIILKAIEGKVKTGPFLSGLIKKYKLNKEKDIVLVVVGGGLLMNVGAYLAERLSVKLVLFPTTVIAMADSSGGKVRVNFVLKGRAYKHFYKSFYEPNAMFLDDRFLKSLPKKQIQIGLVEVIKHSLFQSPKLCEYLLKSGKKLFSDSGKLKKAILWAADLKRVCMEIDVEENENGSRRILRGGHDFSDRLEEDLKLKIPHGIAVAIGIIRQLEMERDRKLLSKAKELFRLLGIPCTLESFYKWQT